METLRLKLENCYGLKKLEETLDFGGGSSFAIYAPNGSMKSSLYETLKDVSEGADSQDRIFPTRTTVREIKDEAGNDVPPTEIVVVAPYDETFGTEKASTLLVDARRRKQYEKLMADIQGRKTHLLAALKKQSRSKRDLEAEISSTFTARHDDFLTAIGRIKDEVPKEGTRYADFPYDVIFDPKTIEFLGMKDFKVAIEDYIKQHNDLLAKSAYFRRGIFNYYDAEEISASLDDHGFFDANHKLTLVAGKPTEIVSAKQLQDLIAAEKQQISNDPVLRKKFAEIERLLAKNANMRAFQAYLDDHHEILAELSNIKALKEKVWKSYLNANLAAFQQLVETIERVDAERRAIEAEAAKQSTHWERVIKIFNNRFAVPFKLVARNKASAVLATAPLEIGFVFEDGDEHDEVDQGQLLAALSTGEKKALYILNVIFEVEARKLEPGNTLFVFDDIADSFDYRNKYAIIQYLRDIALDPKFKLLILTHNFDFFRTIQSRLVDYSRCKMAIRSANEVKLHPARGIKNIFITDWKGKFATKPRERIACIAFMRNMLEYTKGDTDPDFLSLTALLHWRPNTPAIPHSELDRIYNGLFGTTVAWPHPATPVLPLVFSEADTCLDADDAINLENKIVLSVAIRLKADRFMVEQLNDAAFWNGLAASQTKKLYDRYVERFGRDSEQGEIMDRVVLMTPENIHLNSFMYEPIMDMGDHHLRQLYRDVTALEATKPPLKQDAIPA